MISHSFHGRTMRTSAHADAADVGAGLHDPVEHARPVRDVARQVGLEDDVHRAGDAHLAVHAQAGILGDLANCRRRRRSGISSGCRIPCRSTRSRTRVVTPSASCTCERYSVDSRALVPRAQAALNRIGSMKFCGRSIMCVGLASWCSARAQRMACPRCACGRAPRRRALVQNTLSPIRSCGVP